MKLIVQNASGTQALTLRGLSHSGAEITKGPPRIQCYVLGNGEIIFLFLPLKKKSLALTRMSLFIYFPFPLFIRREIKCHNVMVLKTV